MQRPFTENVVKNTVMIVGVLLLCFLITLLLLNSGLFDHFNPDWVDQQILARGGEGIGYFIVIVSLGTAIGLPRQLAAFLAGYAFGTFQGLLLATLAATTGCAVSYFVARLLLSRWLSCRYANQSQQIRRFLNDKLITKTLIIRLMPAGNNLLTNLLCGSCRIHAGRFIGASAIGFIPQMSIFALAGSGFVVQEYWKLALSAVLFVISVMLSYKLYRDYQAELKT